MDIPFLGAMASISIDWLIIGFVFIVGALDTYRSGSSRVAALSLALPLTLLAMPWLADTAFIGATLEQLSGPVALASLWIAMFIVFFMLINRMTYTFGGGAGRVIQSVIAGLVAAIIFIVIWLMAPLSALWDFGASVESVFGPAHALLWLIGAYAALAFARS